MSATTQVASFRRVTPGIVASARLAMANDVPDTTKSEIALLLKKAAPIFGIDGTTYHVMDILLGLSRAEDWKGAGRPVVAISNAKLAEYTMRSQRTVIRCIRRLVEVGLAAYRDSSTGRRFVYRNDNGEAVVGYGIDFTPSRVRVEEIRAAVDQYHLRLNADLAAKRDIARLSRAIEDLCVAFKEHADELRAEMNTLISQTAGLHDKAEDLRQLHARAVRLAAPEMVDAEMAPEGDTTVMPYINTTPESYSKSMNKRTHSNEREHSIKDGFAAQKAYETKLERRETQEQDPRGPKNDRDPSEIQSDVLASVSIGLLQAACRETQSMTGSTFDSWPALVRAGETLRRMIGLSEAGWQDGCQRVGPYAAAAILATVLEKSIRDPEQISKPEGYFRAMIDRAIDGKLYLERSLFGLADRAYGD